MKSYTFGWEIQTLLEQFTSALNDIIVKQYNNDKSLSSPLNFKKVNFVYSPKQRIIANLTNPAPGGLTLPAVAVTITGINRDGNRVFNKNDGFNIFYNPKTSNESFVKKILQPVPINISVNVSILTKFQNDMDQILTNFIPYCDPYFVISWMLPLNNESKNNYELRTEVLWGGSVNVQYPADITANQSFRISADTSFTIKGWLFKKMEEPIKRIYTINSDFNTFETINDDFINQNTSCVLKNIEDFVKEAKI